MDAPRFDRFAKILAAPRSRRGALAAVLGSAIGLVSVGSLSSPGGVASREKSRRKNRQHGDVIAQGPCGDGGPKHNACKRHGQCCTGYCDRKKRCRCRRPGDSCTEVRNCCPERGGTTCQNGVCQLPTGGECSPGEARSCYSGPDGTVDIGICQSGVQTCAADGTWGPCAGEVLPRVETCNGLDDDCDGVVDEGSSCPVPTPPATA